MILIVYLFVITHLHTRYTRLHPIVTCLHLPSLYPLLFLPFFYTHSYLPHSSFDLAHYHVAVHTFVVTHIYIVAPHTTFGITHHHFRWSELVGCCYLFGYSHLHLDTLPTTLHFVHVYVWIYFIYTFYLLRFVSYHCIVLFAFCTHCCCFHWYTHVDSSIPFHALRIAGTCSHCPTPSVWFPHAHPPGSCLPLRLHSSTDLFVYILVCCRCCLPRYLILLIHVYFILLMILCVCDIDVVYIIYMMMMMMMMIFSILFYFVVHSLMMM